MNGRQLADPARERRPELRPSLALKKSAREVARGAKTTGRSSALDQLDAGDVLMTTWLDRLAPSTRDLLNAFAAVTGKQPGIACLGDTWADTTTPRPPGAYRARRNSLSLSASSSAPAPAKDAPAL